MKFSKQLSISATMACISYASFHFQNALAGPTNTLPVSAALPTNSAGPAGFIIRMVQAPGDADIANNSLRALHQINGTLVDGSGITVTNEAIPGPLTNGAYSSTLIDFEKDGLDAAILDLDLNPIATFGSELFPGIPGNGGHTTKFTLEAIGFLQLAVGQYTFGICTTAERTDFNDDDSYQVWVATNPHDFFGLKVAEYERIAPGFRNGWRNENLFTVKVTQAGLYPFRILFWQGGNGANLHFYSINTDTGVRTMVNDPFDTAAIKSFQSSTSSVANGSYLAEAAPPAASDGNSAAAPVTALIVDGQTTVATNAVQLYLNNTQVTPQSLTKANGKVSLTYKPNATRTTKNNAVRLEFKDSAGVTNVANWSFGIVVAGGSATTVTGQWDFENGNLAATVGQPLEYLDGTNGLTKQGTLFGTTTTLGIPDIGGKVARVMQVPGDLKREIGYVMKHGISPNGGGTLVNQYTLIMDVYVDTTGASAASLLQISSTANTDDGDLFWQGNNFGQGTGGYNGRGTFTTGAWHRIVAAYDEAATPPVVSKFVDGIKQDDWTANQGLDNSRRSLLPTAVLFGDGDQDERRRMWVNSIQIRSGKISDAEAVVLGGPSADGIPQVIPSPNVTGQWDFEFGDLGATVGSNLAYLDPTVDGPNGSASDKTQFGAASSFSIAPIGGTDVKVMRVPGTLDRKIGFVMDHRIKPNGGGTKVNQYTLIMDIFVAPTGASAAALLQISSTNNTDDGDLFWQGNNFGQGSGGYNGTGAFTTGAWHRIAAAYDETATPPVVVKYVDGVFQDNWTANQGLDNARRALLPTAVLFGDGDQDERREMFVNSIQIRSARLSNAEMEALGAPAAGGIPLVITGIAAPPQLSIARNSNRTVTVSWQTGTGYVLESNTTLGATGWGAVSGVTNQTITLTPSASATFYRLRQ